MLFGQFPVLLALQAQRRHFYRLMMKRGKEISEEGKPSNKKKPITYFGNKYYNKLLTTQTYNIQAFYLRLNSGYTCIF